jgi:glycosyltransferase involved in cell wall biosynthesis
MVRSRMSDSLTILCAAKLFANLLERYLEPLNRLELVSRILVVRHEALPERLDKVENLAFKDGGTFRNLGRMALGVDAALKREKVDWVLGFNPVPWGAVACLAAQRHGVPVSLSFIGRDFKQIQRRIAAPLWPAIRAARVITVTGERMRTGLIERGIPAERIRILPHAIDTHRFSPGTDEPDLDVVSVGQLIHRKRMDVLIDAVALLRDRGVTARVGILGQGPLEGALRQRIEKLSLTDRVELLGYRDDVETVLKRGRLFALVSEWEGVPFAMIEAMSSGLVPIVTDVGTIADWIKEGQNGHFVPVGDASALALTIERLLAQRDHRAHLRDAALSIRSSVSLESGAAFWREVLAGPGS